MDMVEAVPLAIPEGLTGRILSLAAIFPIGFSIDWLLELTREKALDTLEALGHGLGRKWVQSPRTGFYEFTSEEIRAHFKAALEPSRSEGFHRGAVGILLRELPESPEKSRAVAKILLELPNDLDGCRRLIEAGNVLRRSFQASAALGFYLKALEDLEALGGGDPADRLFIEAAIQYSKLSSATLDSGRVIDTLLKAIAMASRLEAVDKRALLQMHLAKQEWLRSRYDVALRHFDDAWSGSRHISDDDFQRSARVFSMFFHYWQGRFKDAIISYEQYAPEIESIPQTHFPLQAGLTIASCYAHCGQIPQGIGMLDAIREHCLKSGNLGVAGHALVTIAMLFCETGRAEEAVTYYDTAWSHSLAGHNIFAQVSSLLGMAYSSLLLNRMEKAAEKLGEFIRLSRDAQMDLRNYPAVMEMCWAMELGRLERVEGLDLLDEIGRAVNSQNVYMQGMGYRYKALYERRRGSTPGQVIPVLEKAVSLLEISGHQVHLAAARLDLARELFNAGRAEEARKMAGPPAKYLLSVDKVLLPDDLRHLTGELRSEKNLLREILELGQDLVTLQPNRDLVGRVIHTASRLTGAERGAIFIKDEVSGRPMLTAAKNLTREDLTSPEFAGSLELIEQTYGSAKGRVVNFDPDKNAGPGGWPIRSCILVPMVLRREVIGVLYLDNRLLGSAFMAADIEILDYFAAQASIAMENARAYAVLQDRLVKQREEKQYYEEQYLERLNFDDIIGRSRPIRKVFRQIDSVAGTDANVLILGETGVGKELVARAIHQRSPRKNGPFIRVNCSAFSEHLMASELFGHEKGAFTGATNRRLGRFELADGGTLFLDEIGDIPMNVQVRLLLVLQSREFERVGGQETLKSDFRLMAATNRDLGREVLAGRFRQDLYYRLNVFPLMVPPLRDRPEDIPLLAGHFLRMYAKRQNKAINGIPDREMDRLRAYHWPGNVRELENLIERGVILYNGSSFRIPEIKVGLPATAADGIQLTHSQNERTHIIRVLKITHGKISGPNGAAEILDLHPNTLRYRIRKLAIGRRDWLEGGGGETDGRET